MILHTEIKGSGEAVVILQTGLQTAATDFIQLQTDFIADYQLVLPDLRGHGKSTSSDISNFFEDSAEDLEETLESLGLDSVHVVGASLGALAAIHFSKRYPDRVKSLTISGVTKQRPENWLEMHKEDTAAQAGLLKNEQAVEFFNELHGPDWIRFIEMACNEDWYPFHETGDLKAISCPILIIAGEDSPHEAEGALEYSFEQDNVHAAVIPFAAHLVHSEQPEIYSKLLKQFLQSTQVSAAIIP